MRRGGFIAVCLLSWPAVAADKPVEPPDPEFLEFLGEFTDEDQDFVSYIESGKGERELKRAEKETAKEDDHE